MKTFRGVQPKEFFRTGVVPPVGDNHISTELHRTRSRAHGDVALPVELDLDKAQRIAVSLVLRP